MYIESRIPSGSANNRESQTQISDKVRLVCSGVAFAVLQTSKRKARNSVGIQEDVQPQLGGCRRHLTLFNFAGKTVHIARLWIHNFRGIRKFTWNPVPGINCLIGPGDSCKTTILDAIDLLLAERRTATFDDLDFYDADPRNHIRIAAVIDDLPAEFLRDDRYGLLLSGWNETTKKWQKEPSEQEGFKPVLALVLHVDDSLEPAWTIYEDDVPVADRKSLRFADRKLLAPARLGVYSDRHLSWGRGSALQRVGAHPERLPAQPERVNDFATPGIINLLCESG